MPKQLAYDRILFYTTALLVLTGIFMVGSASYHEALRHGMPAHSMLLKHIAHMAVGIAVMFVVLKIPYRKWNDRRVIFTILAFSLLGLCIVFLMPAAGGSHRWIRFGGLSLQPSEFVKVAAVLFTACLLARREDRVDRFWAVPLPCLLVLGLFASLIAIEPDLGSAVMMLIACATLVFVAGLPWRYIFAASGLGIAGFSLAVIAEPYRLKRIAVFLNPGTDSLGAGYQLKQSLIALGSGGLTGVGPGQGGQKAIFLPAAHTDFIYSVVGEEIGLLGTSLLLAAFLVVFWRGLRTATRAPDRFGFYLALGLTSLLVFQSFIHFGVCLGLLPTKGLPLPLISYGGSSLVASMAAVGLLLNVSQHSN
jgi:cell division protein FtsW